MSVKAQTVRFPMTPAGWLHLESRELGAALLAQKESQLFLWERGRGGYFFYAPIWVHQIAEETKRAFAFRYGSSDSTGWGFDTVSNINEAIVRRVVATADDKTEQEALTNLWAVAVYLPVDLV